MEQEFIGIDLGSNSLRGVRMCVSGDTKMVINAANKEFLKDLTDCFIKFFWRFVLEGATSRV